MKITQVRSIYPRYRVAPAAWRRHFWQMVVRIDTDVRHQWLGSGWRRNCCRRGNQPPPARVAGGAVASTALKMSPGSWTTNTRPACPTVAAGSPSWPLAAWTWRYGMSWPGPKESPSATCWAGRRRDEVRAYATGPDCAWYRDLGFNATIVFAGAARKPSRRRGADI